MGAVTVDTAPNASESSSSFGLVAWCAIMLAPVRRKGLTTRLRKLTYDGRHDPELVLSLRADGWGYKRIAQRLGISRDGARELVQRLERLERARRGV